MPVARNKEYGLSMDMTPMIDCVFQLMIFFIVTFKLDNDQINEKIELAKSPNGPKIEEKIPGTMIVEVDDKGALTIGRVPLNEDMLYGIIKQAGNRIGNNNVQILLRADKRTKHVYVKRAMDACTRAGVWRIQFAALKKKGG
jgi:biopolymer transport protein ExbD